MSLYVERNLRLISVILILPAVILCSAGILYSAFGWNTVNDFFGGLMAIPWFRHIFSPAIVLGGPVIVFALNFRAFCHVQAQRANGEWLLRLGIRRRPGNLIPFVAAGLLLGLLLSYAFVENFQIVPR